MRSVWKHQIRPAIAIVSLLFFLSLLLRDRGSLESSRTTIRPRFSQLQPNSRQKFVPIIAQRHLLTEGVPGVEGERGEDGDDARNLLRPYHHEETFQNESLVAEHGGDNLIEGTSECVRTKQHAGKNDSCSYVKSIAQCSSGTLVEYTHIFYCYFSGTPILAFSVLLIWLIALFYMLGNTAADFFCLAIGKLAELMNLSPTLAGVTLLPLGNGAPDVFASITAFVGASGQGQVGLNSVLGGATFVSSVVAGSVSLVVAASGAEVHLDKQCFLRDIGFFLFTLAVLTWILFVGKIHFLGAILYLCIYAVYAVTVAVVEICSAQSYKSSSRREQAEQALQPLLEGIPIDDRDTSTVLNDDFGIGDNPTDAHAGGGVNPLPQWRWAPHVAIFSQQSHIEIERQPSLEVGGRPQLWGNEEQNFGSKVMNFLRQYASFLAWPLTVPRRLTIPQVGSEDGWSKTYAVCSATFALPFLAMVWDGKDGGPFGSAWREYLLAWVGGIVLGGVSFFTVKREEPQGNYLLPWAAGGFIMSIVWFYVIANELVAALVALGVILDIDPAILGLTVLAWGNSVGDLMSNLFLAKQGGEQLQIAFSGCYAGPMFNTLIGLGLSLAFGSWKAYPASYVIPDDDSLFLTMSFLVAGLIWALVTLLYQKMRPTKLFGVGLLGLYVSFLCLRLAYALGLNPNLLALHRN